eukprot:gene7900-10723_t
MLSKKNVDELSGPSREFYDNAHIKMNISLLLASLGMMLLGFTSTAGGNAQSYKYQSIGATGSKYALGLFLTTITLRLWGWLDAASKSLGLISSGYGFACFALLLATIASLLFALYISPLVSSPNEKKILLTPQEVNQIGSTVDPPIAVSPYTINNTTNAI